MPQTIIFDMDGVLFDTETLYMNCWKEIASSYQITGIEEVVKKCIGVNNKKTEEIILFHYGAEFPYDTYRKEISKRFMEHVHREGMPLKKGAKEILSGLKERGVRIGLASSTSKDRVEEELKMAGLFEYFDVILCGDMVTKSKPDPEIFLTCANKLEAEPETTFVIEDSYNGIRAAKRAGMKPIMVPDLLMPTTEIRELCTAVLPDLPAVLKYLSNIT